MVCCCGALSTPPESQSCGKAHFRGRRCRSTHVTELWTRYTCIVRLEMSRNMNSKYDKTNEWLESAARERATDLPITVFFRSVCFLVDFNKYLYGKITANDLWTLWFNCYNCREWKQMIKNRMWTTDKTETKGLPVRVALLSFPIPFSVRRTIALPFTAVFDPWGSANAGERESGTIYECRTNSTRTKIQIIYTKRPNGRTSAVGSTSKSVNRVSGSNADPDSIHVPSSAIPSHRLVAQNV